jgi:hypothetical protein
MKRTLPLILALILAQVESLTAAADAPQPNIVFILVDDMGYGDPQCFNPQSKIATPNIDRLAQEGMRFTDAHAGASLCVASRYSLLSGRMPYRNWNTTEVKGVKMQSTPLSPRLRSLQRRPQAPHAKSKLLAIRSARSTGMGESPSH